jgi:16S rRNA (cytosine1402-N4)-methyltransferase
VKGMDESNSYHDPVLLTESVKALIRKKDGLYIDGTLGGSGHSKAFLSVLNDEGRLIAFDQDRAVVRNLPQDNRFVWVHSNFRYLKKYLQYYKIEKIDGVFADLGVSSYHFDQEERGFSFRSGSPLDMRMSEANPMTAHDVLMSYPQDRLLAVFHDFGELTNASRIAAKLVSDRKNRSFGSCIEFATWLEQFSYGKPHQFLAKAFQALRMEVNEEIKCLQEFLEQAGEMLVSGGVLAVISYHSLEDRVVKNFLRGTANDEAEKFYGRRKKIFLAENKKVIQPSENEQSKNPRSRSAKLRIGIKI